MKLDELRAIAEAAYEPPMLPDDDTIARFILNEIGDIANEENAYVDDEEQVTELVRRLETGIADIERVCDALRQRATELREAVGDEE